MHDYERLGVFYLGRHRDPQTGRTGSQPLCLDSRSLVTHGLVVGMTGSGKTGLCFDLIEEAALDGIPAIVIDPKGDLTNLLLTFPELRPEDFAPWINEDDARRKNVPVAEYAAQQAALWRQGLADWDQDGERIRRLRAAADFVVYTPGSRSGRPVSLLGSFAAPPVEVREDAEALRERVTATATGLLGLVGIDADPVRSREAVLLANLLQNAWAAGRDLDLPGLIQEIQTPPIQRLGVLELEAFFPAKDRFELGLQLNNLLASPAFAGWMEGEALDLPRLLFTDAGQPRVAIFSVAHLSDSARMFFVSLLLNQVLGWMRSQSGTDSLRALVYMDEIHGYFPPVANPPAKPPLLSLLKQGRAFGVGVVLATQNPVDLDYKGLANIGTWFIGRLQTERDRARVLDGMEGAAAGSGQAFDRPALETLIGGLASRVFLLHSVHADAPELFESRWAMSYLRGPLSRTQIKQLTDARRGAESESGPVQNVRAGVAATPAMAPSPSAPAPTTRPVLSPRIPQFFLPPRGGGPARGGIRYEPRLLGAARIEVVEPRLGLSESTELILLATISDAAVPVDWAAGVEATFDLADLGKEPPTGLFLPVAAAGAQEKNYDVWARDLRDWICAHRPAVLLRSAALGETSRGGETEREFRVRLQQLARERRDATADKLRQKYAPRLAALQERIRRAEAAQAREAGQAQKARMDTLVSLGSTLLGAFLGRRAVSASTLGRAATTARGMGWAVEQAADVGRAEETVAALRQQAADLEATFQSEVDVVAVSLNPAVEKFETVELLPKRTNVKVQLVALVWLPNDREATGQPTSLS